MSGEAAAAAQPSAEDAFGALGLDARVVRAAAKRFALPSAVQARVIPLALAGKARPRAAAARAARLTRPSRLARARRT